MARAAAGRFGWLYGGGLRGGGLSGGGPRADGLLRCRLLRRSLLALRRLALVLEAAAGARAVWLGLGLGEARAVLRRSAERRVGKECVRTCRYRGSPLQ